MNSLRSGVVVATALIAAVTAQCSASHAAVVNGGFESPLVSSFPSNFPFLVPPNYVYIPNGGPPATADSWTYTAGAGLINGPNPGAFLGEPGFVGDQYAFIQS